jgi:c-di-GMP-binding flagellar brake protein YcgR
MVTSGNRRIFYRHPMNLQLALRVAGVRAPVSGTLIDISGGGAMVSSKTALRAPIQVEFDLPRPGLPVLRLPGTIRKVTYNTDRSFRYAVEFALDDEAREELLRFISDQQRRERRPDDGRAAPETEASELRAHRRVDVSIPVAIAIADQARAIEATIVDLSSGGARVALDRVLRQEWTLTLRFYLNRDEVTLTARVLPGVKQLRGQYVQSLSWVHPDPTVTAQIARFVRH